MTLALCGNARNAVLVLLLVVLASMRGAAGEIVIGTVKSGGSASNRPLSGVSVTLYEATASQPKVLGRSKSNAAGQFWFTSAPSSTENGIFFATADVANGVQFVTILGPAMPSGFTINELTTVAASYSMAQFYKTGVIAGNPLPLRLAAGMNDNLVSIATGDPSEVLLSSPNGDESNSLRSTLALANLLASCAQSDYFKNVLVALTVSPTGVVAANTAQALASLARNPAPYAAAIWYFSLYNQMYGPALAAPPDAWTIAVKINDSGDDNHLISGVGTIAFDKNGFAWVTNNTVQFTTYSGQFNLVFQPNGKPADGTNGSPISPLLGGGALGGGFGVAIDRYGYVWMDNFGWGGANPTPYPPGLGSAVLYTAAGAPLTYTGFYNDIERVQGITIDANDNVWLASWGNNRVVVYLGGNPARSVYYQEPDGSLPFDVHIAPDGGAWVTHTGGTSPSYVAKYYLVGETLYRQFVIPIGFELKGFDVDSYGNAWIPSQDSKVFAIEPNGVVHGPFRTGGIDAPWSVTVDSEDNVWVANFGTFLASYDKARVTKLCGFNPATRPLGTNVGDALTPETGYNLPSAGAEVLLHNGDPLYGPGSPPAYTPMMRLTKVAIDQAGNLWALNNWKPDIIYDFLHAPGGDGIVIFVGLAPPASPPRQ